MKRPFRSWIACVACGLALPVGCRITPEEVRRIEVENELLRHEIRVIREKCDQPDRQFELDVEKRKRTAP